MNVVTLSLFGEGYDKYLPAWVLAFLNIFPRDAWRLRIYCAYRRLVVTHLHTAKLIDAEFLHPLPLCKAMLWRMLPVFEEDTGHVWCRDLDCLPMPRDREAMEQFIQSKVTVHTIHDSEQHKFIMGGLCGFHAPTFRMATRVSSVEQLYEIGEKLGVVWDRRGADQVVLNSICLREGGPTLLEHRYNGWSQGPHRLPPRVAGTYRCEAYSTPLPNVGTLVLPAKDLQDQADLLADHLGAPGFDHEVAWKFWSEHGDPKITAAVSKCMEVA